MNCLSIIAELKKCSVAISYEGKIFSVHKDADSSSQLAWLTDQLLKENSIKYDEIQKIITISGPGSFTGIRVAQSLCKGLSLALKIPGVCMSYFDLLSEEFCSISVEYPELIVIKSEKSQYYYRYQNQIGVGAGEDFSSMIKEKIVIIGEQTEEIGKVVGDCCAQCFECPDFRNAQRLLAYAEKIFTPIRPLYINAQKTPGNYTNSSPVRSFICPKQ